MTKYEQISGWQEDAFDGHSWKVLRQLLAGRKRRNKHGRHRYGRLQKKQASRLVV
jgi:hypothetical protein